MHGAIISKSVKFAKVKWENNDALKVPFTVTSSHPIKNWPKIIFMKN